MRNMSKALCRLCLFLAILAMLLLAGNMVFVRPDTFARLTLLEMQERTDIELAFVGSSIVRNHFDPELITEATGKRAFNATIPCLSLQGALSVTEELYRHNQLDTVVLVVEPSMFDTTEEDIEAENILMPYISSSARQLAYYRRLVSDDHRYLDRALLYRTFPVQSFGEMVKTVTLHLQPHSIPASAVNPHDPDGTYAGHGYVRYSTRPRRDALLRAGFRREPVTGEYALNPVSETWLREYRTLVESHGSHLLILIFPNFSTAYLAYPSWWGYNANLERFCREEGIQCINLAMAKPELLPDLDDYYFDRYHLNGDGAKLFSMSVARLLNLLADGEPIADLFYPDKWSWLVAHDTVPNVWIDAYTGGEWNYAWEQDPSALEGLPGQGFVYLANANHIQGTIPEYRFVSVGSDGSETLLADYSPDGILLLPEPLPESCTLRVYARPQQRPGQAPVWNDYSPAPLSY